MRVAVGMRAGAPARALLADGAPVTFRVGAPIAAGTACVPREVAAATSRGEPATLAIGAARSALELWAVNAPFVGTELGLAGAVADGATTSPAIAESVSPAAVVRPGWPGLAAA